MSKPKRKARISKQEITPKHIHVVEKGSILYCTD